MPLITCPSCGNVGPTEYGSDDFETRGQWQRKPVRKCLQCGAGMTVHFRLGGMKAKLIDAPTWQRMETAWDQKVEADSKVTDEVWLQRFRETMGRDPGEIGHDVPPVGGRQMTPDELAQLEKHIAAALVEAMARGEYRYTRSGDLIEDGAEPDLPRMRRPTPLGWPLQFWCSKGHVIRDVAVLVSERPTNSGIHHGYCLECHGDDYLSHPVWAYPEWDEPLPPNVTMTTPIPIP